MTRPTLLLLFFCALAGAAALALRPGSFERIEAELDTLEPGEALDLLGRQAERRTLPPALRLEHARLAAADGDLATAALLYRGLLGEAEMEETVAVALIEVLRLGGDLAGAARLLEAVLERWPTDERRAALGAWYRALGLDADEARVLGAAPPGALTDWEAERLLHLVLRHGSAPQVEATLRRLSARPGDGAGVHVVSLAARLAAAGREEEAAREVVAWLHGRPGTSVAAAMTAELARRGLTRIAAATVAAAMEADAEAAHPLIVVLARQGALSAARDLEMRWLAVTPRLDRDGWHTVIEIASLTGDLSALRMALRAAGNAVPQEELADALAQFVRYGGPRALAEHRARLTPAFLAAEPLIAAAWSSAQGRAHEVQVALSAAAAGPLGTWEEAVWLQIAGSLRGSPFYRALFESLPVESPLRPALMGRVTVRPDVAAPQ